MQITKIKLNYLLLLTVVLLLSLTNLGVTAEQNVPTDTLIDNSLLIYTPQEMLSFNIHDYLEQNAPHLLNYSEIISHWSGYSSISPQIILSLIEYQTLLISNDQATLAEIEKPLSFFSDADGFSAQIKDVVSQLAESYYQQNNDQLKTTDHVLQNFLDLKSNPQLRIKEQSIEETYDRLFPDVRSGVSSKQIYEPQGGVSIPPDNYLQLPYPVGGNWRNAGSHAYDGSTNGTHSSLDFWGGVPGGWGSNTSNLWIVAAHGGTIIKHSSCYVEVIGQDGWSTSYYHLDNVVVNTSQVVTRDTALANYANNQAQALCQGGSSYGPHLHFSLKYDGGYVDINGVQLSGFSVHTGRVSYDTDCNYFWLEKNGSKYCAWTAIYNPGITVVYPDLTINTQNVSNTEPGPRQTFTTQVNVGNIGDSSTNSSTLRIYQSTDSIISASDQQLTTESIPTLLAGSLTQTNSSLTAPNTSGTYWIGSCVDSVTGEENTSNNCSSGIEITVSVLKGDIDNNYEVNLKDLVYSLQILASISPSGTITKEASINGDQQIGVAESIFILHKLAGLN